MATVAPPEQLRRDARDNRAAILDAARELFADSADVAMCQVAKRAGVGQGTLYRHFPNRGALAAEILDEYIVRFEELQGILKRLERARKRRGLCVHGEKDSQG